MSYSFLTATCRAKCWSISTYVCLSEKALNLGWIGHSVSRCTIVDQVQAIGKRQFGFEVHSHSKILNLLGTSSWDARKRDHTSRCSHSKSSGTHQSSSTRTLLIDVQKLSEPI